MKRTHQIPSDLSDFEAQVYEAIKPFGFYKQAVVPDADFVSFAIEKERMAPEFASLAGASRDVSIAIAPQDLTITIRDMRHRYETQFVQALKRHIEDRLEQHYGIRGLKFERQWNLFA